MATATKTAGFNVTCPFCNDSDATVSLNLNDLAECKCSGCDEDFTPEQARNMLMAEAAKWERIIEGISIMKQLTK